MGRKFPYQHCLILLVSSLLFSSCTERIDIELESTSRRLVVEGMVTSDLANHYVILSSTSDYFSNIPPSPVRGALVELSFGDETIQLLENDFLAGRYEAPIAFRGVIGTTYQLDINELDVNQDGQEESYHASSTMPGGPVLESIELRYYTTPIVSGYTIFMYTYHPLYSRDWFGFKTIKNSVVLTNTLSTYSVLSDDIFDGGYFPGLPVGFLNDDNTEEAVHPGDTITFELNCIEEAYYNFVIQAQLEIAGNIPLFSGPPANIASNVSNGAQGIFAAYSIQRISVIMLENNP